MIDTNSKRINCASVEFTSPTVYAWDEKSTFMYSDSECSRGVTFSKSSKMRLISFNCNICKDWKRGIFLLSYIHLWDKTLY